MMQVGSLVLLLCRCWNPPVQHALLFSCSGDVGIHSYSMLSCSPALVMLESTHTACSLALLLWWCWNPLIQRAVLLSCSGDVGIHSYSVLSCSPALVILESTHTTCSLALLLCWCWHPGIHPYTWYSMLSSSPALLMLASWNPPMYSCSVDDGIHPYSMNNHQFGPTKMCRTRQFIHVVFFAKPQTHSVQKPHGQFQHIVCQKLVSSTM